MYLSAEGTLIFVPKQKSGYKSGYMLSTSIMRFGALLLVRRNAFPFKNNKQDRLVLTV
jgi:hypothetical protein